MDGVLRKKLVFNDYEKLDWENNEAKKCKWPQTQNRLDKDDIWPPLLTWINFNPSMNKQLYPL